MELFILVVSLGVLLVYALAVRKGRAEGARETTPLGRVTRDVSGAGNDTAGSDSFWEVESPRDTRARLRIEYRAESGDVTARDVDVTWHGPTSGGNTLLTCFCHLRGERRTFRADRIVTCIDRETGESIDDPAGWLHRRWLASPDRALAAFRERAWDALRVMCYISNADGDFSESERRVIVQAVRGMAGNEQIRVEQIHGLIDAMDSPTELGYKRACGRLAERGKLAREVLGWCEKIAQSDERVDEKEAAALGYLRKRMAG